MKMETYQSFSSNFRMVDSHGRKITKLRLSILDACNMRCFYCMPESPHFLKKQEWLGQEEIVSICRNLKDFGISEVRVTGGEPLLREDFQAIMKGLSSLSFEKLAITTNGIKLAEHLDFLQDIGSHYLNISLDSLKRDRFSKITRTDAFDCVVRTIERAAKMNFKIKLNAVVLKGINDDELIDFIHFGKNTGVEVRFLEAMRIGMLSHSGKDFLVGHNQMLEKLKKEFVIDAIDVPLDSTSRVYSASGTRFGIIASETLPFCGNCSRLRMGPKGELRPCLFVDHGPSLKGVKREDYPRLLGKLIEEKPTSRIKASSQSMYQLGG